MNRFTLVLALAWGTSATAAELELHGTGSGPKAEIRYVATVGQKTSRVVTVGVDTNTKFMGQDMAIPMPEVSFTVDFVVTAVKGERIDATWAYRDLKVEASHPLAQAGVAPLKAKLDGAHGTMSYTDTGRLLAFDTAGETVQGDNYMDARNYVGSVPVQPLGVGASWSVLNAEQSAEGLAMKASQTFTVTAIDDGRATVQVTMTGGAPGGGTITIEGMQADVKSMEVSADGTMVIGGAPLIVDMQMVSGSEMTLGMMGQTMEQKATSTITVAAP